MYPFPAFTWYTCICCGGIKIIITWMSHECHSVSNHWLLYCLFYSFFWLITKKTSRPSITGPLWGESLHNLWRDCPHKGPVMMKMSSCHDVIIIPTDGMVISVARPSANRYWSCMIYRWLSAELCYLRCSSNEDTMVLHQAFNSLAPGKFLRNLYM